MNEIFHRMSIRQYTEQPVTDEQIELLLRAAMAAPSACNQQPWEYYVVTDPALKTKLADSTPYTKPAGRAPLVIVPCYREDCQVPPFAHIDLSASVENLLLEADSLGLGAVWMGLAPMTQRQKMVQEMLGMPENLSPFCLIAVGYPAENRTWQDRFDPARIHRI